MPGCGKSTVGVLLAKRLGWGFIDTDLLIQQANQQTLQAIVEQQGFHALRQLEEKILLGLSPIKTVIATGGSAVYSEPGIAQLKTLGQVIYLQLPLPTLIERVGDFSQRGIASDQKASFEQIFTERCPLYEKSANLQIDCAGLNTEQVVSKIITLL